MIRERSSPADDQRRFLKVFEFVCQTLSYAHSRGVAHRDLKPSNVMVGAHGQVLVVDWGLAKVRGQGDEKARKKQEERRDQKTIISTVRSESGGSVSMVGSILGTPGYMAPEQARGETDQLDERSDVFALGAILCEILTGEPPYTGGDRNAVTQAARAELDDAKARLDESSADPELIDLALACMAPAKMARPADAGEVANEIHAYLVSVEEREHQSREAEASAHVRVDAERKSRRLTLLLAASVLLTLIVGAGGYLYVHFDNAARAQASAHLTESALQKATRLHGQAVVSDAAEDWAEALSAAKEAVSLANSADAPPALAERARTLDDLIRKGRRASSEAAFQRARDGRLSAALDAIRERSLAEPGSPAGEAIGAAFRDYGLDVEVSAPDYLPMHLRDTPTGARFAIALGAWARENMRRGLPSKRQIEMSRACDRDPWRNRLRDATTTEELLALATASVMDERSSDDLVQLALALERAGEPAHAGSLLTATSERYADDFWAAFALGNFLRRHELPPPNSAGSEPHLLALADAWYDGFGAAPTWPEGLLTFGGPTLQRTTNAVSGIYSEHGSLTRHVFLRRPSPDRLVFAVEYADGSIARASIAITDEETPQISTWTMNDTWRWRPAPAGGSMPLTTYLAVRHLRASVALRPESSVVRARLAQALIDIGDIPGAAAQLRGVPDRDEDDPEVLIVRSLLAAEAANSDAALDLARRAVTASPESPMARHRLVSALLAEGLYTEAVAECERQVAQPPRPDLVAECRALAAVDVDLGSFDSGARRPTDKSEAFTLARVLAAHGRHEHAESVYDEWVDVTQAPADDFWAGHYLHAARAAALAARDGTNRTAMRTRALHWLRAEVNGWRAAVNATESALDPLLEYVEEVAALARLRDDPAFAHLRDEEALAGMRDSDRDDFEALWRQVDVQILLGEM